MNPWGISAGSPVLMRAWGDDVLGRLGHLPSIIIVVSGKNLEGLPFSVSEYRHFGIVHIGARETDRENFFHKRRVVETWPS